ncbi:hypothetical protein PS9374_03781 [Planomonospora sphaerica]|uniref:Uncharacterized protein n=1 Tax=Planomonospora sphaerica TaxID=161355 RepID=A0A171DE81_9ACTN|nr:hypothetical protein PS9374_03781 [Planomonospora sphaerica]
MRRGHPGGGGAVTELPRVRGDRSVGVARRVGVEGAGQLVAGSREVRHRRLVGPLHRHVGRRRGRRAPVVGHRHRHRIRAAARERVPHHGARRTAAAAERPARRDHRAVGVSRTRVAEGAGQLLALRHQLRHRSGVRRRGPGPGEHEQGALAPVGAVHGRAAEDGGRAGHRGAVHEVGPEQAAVEAVGEVELVPGQEHAADPAEVDAGHVAARGEALGPDDLALGREAPVVERGLAAAGEVEPAVGVEHAGHVLHVGGEVGQAVQGDLGGRPERGAVEGPPVELPVRPRGVEPPAEHEGAPRPRPGRPSGAHGLDGAERGPVVGAALDGVRGGRARPELVQVRRQDAGERRLHDRAARQREHGQSGVVLPVADAVGVAADPQPLRGRGQVEHADPERPGRVPGQRDAVDRVEGREARPGDGPGTGGVAPERVVGPAEVAADVDRLRGHGHRVAGVAAGVVDPGRVEVRARGVGLPPRVGVAEFGRAAGVGARRRHHEEPAVRRVVHVAHVGVEGAGAGRLVAGGVPVRRLGALAGQVELDDLPAVLPADGGEVAHRHQARLVRRDVELEDLRGAAVLRPGEGQVHERVARAGVGVEGRQGGLRRAVHGREGAPDVQPAPRQPHVEHPRAERRGEARQHLPVRHVEPGQHPVGSPVDLPEGAADVDRLTVGSRQQRLDLTAHVRREGRVQASRRGVEGEEPVAGLHGLVVPLADLGEAAAHEDPVADLDDGVDPAVQGVRREVRRVRGDDAVLRVLHGQRWTAPYEK